jgi:hypothetical protein
MAKRPGVITFIGVIMLIQATLTIVGGVVLLALNTQQRILDETGLSSSELVLSGIVSLVIGAIVLLVTLALLAGSRIARVLVTIVQVLVVAGAAWGMFAHHTGAYLFSGLLQIAIAVFVLWALYNERADEFYSQS